MFTAKIATGLGALVLGLALTVALADVLAAPAQACPMCAEQVAKQDKNKNSGNPSAAYNYSIFAMIGIVGAVCVGMGRLMYVVVKQADADALAAMPAMPAPAATTGTPPPGQAGSDSVQGVERPASA